jgi:hypothetical protein
VSQNETESKTIGSLRMTRLFLLANLDPACAWARESVV